MVIASDVAADPSIIRYRRSIGLRPRFDHTADGLTHVPHDSSDAIPARKAAGAGYSCVSPRRFVDAQCLVVGSEEAVVKRLQRHAPPLNDAKPSGSTIEPIVHARSPRRG